MLIRCSYTVLISLAVICISTSINASGSDNPGAVLNGRTQLADSPASPRPTLPAIGAQPARDIKSIGPDEAMRIRAAAKKERHGEYTHWTTRKNAALSNELQAPTRRQARYNSIQAKSFSKKASIPNLVDYLSARHALPVQDAQSGMVDERNTRKAAKKHLTEELRAWKSSEIGKHGQKFKNLNLLNYRDLCRVASSITQSQPLPVLMEYISRRTAHSVQGAQSGVMNEEHQIREAAEKHRFDELETNILEAISYSNSNSNAIRDSSKNLLKFKYAMAWLKSRAYAQLLPIALLKEYNHRMVAHPTTPAGHDAQFTQGSIMGMSDEHTTSTHSSEDSTSDLKE